MMASTRSLNGKGHQEGGLVIIIMIMIGMMVAMVRMTITAVHLGGNVVHEQVDEGADGALLANTGGRGGCHRSVKKITQIPFKLN